MSQIAQSSFFWPVQTLTGDVGGAVGSAAGNINLLGTAGTITVTGNPVTHTLTISAGASIPTTFHSDAGDATPALNTLTIAGGTNIGTSGAGSTVTINLDPTITLTGVNATTFDTNVAAAGVTLSGTTLQADGTDAAIDITITPKGAGTVKVPSLQITGFTAGTLRSSATGVISSLADGANGTLLIGKTGDVPIWATLTNGNNITATAGANSISIAVTGTTDHAVQVGNVSGSLTSLGIGLTGQVLRGNTAADPSWGAVDLTTDVTGYLPTGSGGTGVGSITAHALVVGDGTNALNELAVGATGETIMGVTGADPIWTGSPSFSGSVTAGTGLTVTTGDATISSGNILIPNSTSTIGQIKFNNVCYAHNFGTNNLFLCPSAGNFTFDVAQATSNIAIGLYALSAITGAYVGSDSHNVAIGVGAMRYGRGQIAAGSPSSMSNCIAIGTRALGGSGWLGWGCFGSENVAIGYESCYNVGASGNTAVGYQALRGTANYNIHKNVAVGYKSAYGLTSNSEGNVIIGYEAGLNAYRPITSVFIGYNAGKNIAGNSANNILIGPSAGINYTNAEANNILIGNGGVVGESTKIRIGSSGINGTFITGIYNTAVGATAGIAIVDSTHQIGTLSGTTGQVLQGGTKPAWSTATYPATATKGDIISASAASTFTAISAGTDNYVLTANGAGEVSSYQYSHALPIELNAQTDSYTLVLGDAGKLITMNKGTANTLTIPKHSAVAFDTGTQILVYQGGAGTTTIAPVDGDVTINSAGGLLDLFAQYSVASLVQISENEWVLSGDLG